MLSEYISNAVFIRSVLILGGAFGCAMSMISAMFLVSFHNKGSAGKRAAVVALSFMLGLASVLLAALAIASMATIPVQ